MKLLLSSEQVRLSNTRLSIPVKRNGLLPSPRSNAAAAFDPGTGQIILFGGLAGGSGNGRYPANAIFYNTRTGAKETKAIPTTFTWSSGVGVGEHIYVGDGHTGSYSGLFRKRAIAPTNSTLVTLSPTPSPFRHSSNLVHHAGKIYRFGGNTSSVYSIVALPGVYDIATNRWSNISQMPYPTHGAAACVYEDRIFVFGGWAPMTRENIIGIQIYDIASDTWSFIPTSQGFTWGSVARHGKYALNVSGTGILNRYDLTNLNHSPKLFAFDADFESWRFCHASFVDEEQHELIIAGGCISFPGQPNYDDLQRSSLVTSIDLNLIV